MSSKLRVAVCGTNALAAALRDLLSGSAEVELYHLPLAAPNAGHAAVDAVIETTNLDLNDKRKTLQEIERHIADDTLILSSVLGVTATQAASWLNRPSRLVGFATFASLKHSELIELACALQTAPAYLDKAERLIASLGKESEVVVDEVGLVFPRILAMIVNEAAFALMEEIASAEDIDVAMQKGTNYPLGPLTWADEAGLDDIFAVLRGLHRDVGEDRYRPAPLLRKLVHAGWLGKQVGRGFYEYANQVKEPLR
jgi:3-hydroxybutyryl-CoA dehydrogenase